MDVTTSARPRTKPMVDRTSPEDDNPLGAPSGPVLDEPRLQHETIIPTVPTLDEAERLQRLNEHLRQGPPPTLAPFLPLLFSFDDSPLTLHNHFHFESFFETELPETITAKTARQVGKSLTISALSLLLCNTIKNLPIMFLLPLYDQARRLSDEYVRPLIEGSPVRHLWVSAKTKNAILDRSFKNGSRMHFGYAFLKAEHLRSYRSSVLIVDESQDMNPEHIPVVAEGMSHSKYGIKIFCGTSKTPETLLESEWKQSSMAEWFIRCDACTKWNIPSLEYDLEKMLGPVRQDISNEQPGLVCARCGRPINPRDGRWRHRREELAATRPGYHISQPIVHIHYSEPTKWAQLLAKRDGFGGYSEVRYKNEVLGEACGKGAQPVSEEELKAAAILPWANNPQDFDKAIENCRYHRYRVLSIDWGGGGVKGDSLTALAVCSYRQDGLIDVVWGCKLRTPNDPTREAAQCLHIFKAFDCTLLAHDFTGSGALRETFLRQKGLPLKKIIPYNIAHAPAGAVIRQHPATNGKRWYFTIDKTRSLDITCEAIKRQKIRFFQYDWKSAEDPGLLHDFLGLMRDRIETARGGDVYLFRRHPALSDDFAHAVNLGACTLWQLAKAWPDVAGVYPDELAELGVAPLA